ALPEADQRSALRVIDGRCRKPTNGRLYAQSTGVAGSRPTVGSTRDRRALPEADQRSALRVIAGRCRKPTNGRLYA
ncbi:hypothetical protein, partial [Stenotrophomonas rhizophila]|uniref:hypothetical protein n=1 Tax=Stenotrophomonas rhizophila TaxID=216778 RepID=UPI0028AC9218